MTIQTSSALRRNARVEYRSLADGQGGVLLHLTTGAYHGVNEVGAVIWSLLDGRSLGELVAALREMIDDAPPGFDAEIRAYVEALVARDLVLGDPV